MRHRNGIYSTIEGTMRDKAKKSQAQLTIQEGYDKGYITIDGIVKDYTVGHR
jgi:hypothetical protein